MVSRPVEGRPALVAVSFAPQSVVPEWTALDLEGLPPTPALDPNESIPVSLQKAVDWVASILTYQPGTSHTHSTLQEVLARRQGVCQDFAHLLLALARSWKIPARYVMGYMDAESKAMIIRMTIRPATLGWRS